tara:strand:- start:1796 stop:2224 length:429 start_codon:yes stop_codon:yes gene_type:complete
MPIGHATSVGRSEGTFVVPDATANGAIRQGATVGLVDVGGASRIEECSCSSAGELFLGFAARAVINGDPVAVVAVRGSFATPIIEGAGTFGVGDAVFLSATAGEVSTTVPLAGAGVFVVQVGIAKSATDLLLITDSRVRRNG